MKKNNEHNGDLKKFNDNRLEHLKPGAKKRMQKQLTGRQNHCLQKWNNRMSYLREVKAKTTALGIQIGEDEPCAKAEAVVQSASVGSKQKQETLLLKNSCESAGQPPTIVEVNNDPSEQQKNSDDQF